ncbi:unnamed protein product [Discosporangium mesarthrocarpum]
MEVSHTGIQLLMQWDDLLSEQRWTAFLAWPHLRPPNLLTRQDKAVTIRWAALRGLSIQRVRTSTTLSLLHDSIIQARLEPSRWLIHHYPALLDAETLDMESPLYLGVLEGAETLIAWENQCDNVRLEWKAAKLMEIFLSVEIQNADINWNAHHYGLLTEHGEPDRAELAMHLAEGFNLHPPRGYSAIHRWGKYGRWTREYLGEALCASRDSLELEGQGLGDTGYKSLLAVCRALSVTATRFTRPSTFTTDFSIHVVKVDLSNNRLNRRAGYKVADMLQLNETVRELRLDGNTLDSQAAAAIFNAARRNQTLRKLSMARNRVGPEVGHALAEMVKKNRVLVYLDVSHNLMGEKNFWESSYKMIHIPSAGPALGASLRFNKTLSVLNVSGNSLGADTGRAFADGVARHKSLTALDLSNNLILPDGGKALAMGLNYPTRSSLTSLNISENHLGHKAGKLFGAVLKRNQNLRHLDLSKNELGTRAAVALANALRPADNKAFFGQATLVSMSLRANGLGANAAKAFGQLLAENNSLTSLDLSRNNLGVGSAEGGSKEGAGALLGHGLRRNATLTSLSLAENSFVSSELRRALEALPGHPSLISTDLSGEIVEGNTTLDIARFIGCGGHAVGSGGANNVGDPAPFSPTPVQSVSLARGGAIAGPGAIALARALSAAPGLVCLDLSDNPLGFKGVKELASALSLPSPTLSRAWRKEVNGGGVQEGSASLSLARCGLGDRGGVLVAEALGPNESVEELDLSGNDMGHEAGMALANSLRVLYRSGKEVRPCSIRRLDLCHNLLGKDAGVTILRALMNPVTEYLDMSFTGLEESAGEAIGRLFRSPSIALRHLNVEHNNLGRDGANAIFWALRRNRTVTHLDLSDNGLGSQFGTADDELEEYGTALSSALTLNQTVRFLDLGTNGISAECGVSMTASIRRNRSLSTLCLENNKLDDTAASTIAKKLRSDRQLATLNLANNCIGWRGGVDIAAALCLNARLVHLDLSNNSLGDGGTHVAMGDRFSAVLVQNKTLKQLSLKGNRIGPAGGFAIAKALHKNNTLTVINLENNRFDQDVGRVFEELLHVNFSLTEIRASPEEIGLDSRATIDDVLTARQKFLDAHQLPETASAGARAGGRNMVVAVAGGSPLMTKGGTSSGAQVMVGGPMLLKARQRSSRDLRKSMSVLSRKGSHSRSASRR